MPKISSVRFALYGLLLVVFSHVHAMVYDNRYIPLMAQSRLSLDGTQSYFSVNAVFATASGGLGIRENNIGIGEIYGFFDQADLAQAITCLGLQNPLISEWRNHLIPWQIDGKFQAQGVSFEAEHHLINNFYIGGSMIFLRSNTYHDFHLQLNPSENNTQSEKIIVASSADKQEVYNNLRTGMFDLLNIRENHVSQAGPGDVDLYLRYGGTWDYIFKCRRIDAGLRLGLMIPSGVKRSPCEPGSIPFGGNGFWGIYGAFDGLFELKENIKVGLFTRFNKRLPRVQERRVPIYREPEIFGAAVIPTRINPGVTIIFSPYIVWEHILYGLGINIAYTLTAHEKDRLTDARVEKRHRVNLDKVRRESKWGTDYFTINLFYDFYKTTNEDHLKPILALRWDIPSYLFIYKRAFKTHRINLSLEVAF